MKMAINQAEERANYWMHCLRSVKELLGNNLAKLLSDRQMSQSELARKLGVHHPVVWRWINGKAWPESKYIDRICDILQVSASELFSADTTASGAREDLRELTLKLAAMQGLTIKDSEPEK